MAVRRENSFRAYAQHRGVSHQAVTRAWRSKRLRESVVVVNGKPTIPDFSKADAEWAANTDVSRLPDAQKLRPHATVGSPGSATDPATVAESERVLPLAQSLALQKYWQAKQAELDFKKAAGELVEAETFAAKMVDVHVQCRTKLLGLPSQAKQRLPHLTHADLLVLDALIRDALEDLVVPGQNASGRSVA